MAEKQGKTPNSLVVTPSYDIEALAARIAPQAAHARELAEEHLSARTRDLYTGDWKRFEAWLAFEGIPVAVVGPEVVATYLGQLQKDRLTPPTIARAYAGIAHHLRALAPEAWSGGHRHPLIEQCLAGIRRRAAREGYAPARKEALEGDEMRRLAALPVEKLGPGRLAGLRNRAALLLGFTGGFRRSEIVGLDRSDVVKTAEGLRVTVRVSKTDQEGAGLVKGIPLQTDPETCPVVALGRWLKAAREAGAPIEGAIFRRVNGEAVGSDRMGAWEVARAVKRACALLGLNPKRFSGHSLRVGFVTDCDKRGVDHGAIMRQTGHKRHEQLLEYIRHKNVFQNNAAAGIMDATAARNPPANAPPRGGTTSR